MRRKATTTAALLVLSSALALVTGCNKNRGLESAFSPSWRAEGQNSTRINEGQELLARLAKLEALPTVPAAVGVTGRGLRGRSLPGGVVWHYVGPVDVLPSLVADCVGFSGGGIVTVLDVESGERRFRVPVSGRRLEGLAYDGEYYTMLLVDSDDARPDELRIVDSHGRTKFVATTTSRLGTPYALGGITLVPWNRQYVSAFDVATGESAGRLLVRDAVHRVEEGGGELWILGAGASHVDQNLLESVGEKALRLSPPKLPGEPPWPIDGSKPRPPRAQPVALWAIPAFDGQARFHAGTYAYGYYEVVVGLDVSRRRVKWANFFPRGMVGSDANQAGITTCLEDGSVWQIRWSDGYAKQIDTLDTRLRGCSVGAVDSQLDGRRAGDLAIQVRQTISGTGANMARVHEFLVADLARSEAARATHALLAIAQDPVTSSGLAERAASYLAERRTGATSMIRVLRENLPAATEESATATGTEGGDAAVEATAEPEDEDFSDVDLELPTTRKRPPPVAALAHALTKMNARNAATVLSLQLAVPSMSGADCRAVLQALDRLGGKKQLPAVRTFFSSFKNGGGDKAMLEALVLAAKFLLRHGTEEDRTLLETAKTDVLTHPELAESLEDLPLGPPITDAATSDGRTTSAPAQDSTRTKPPAPAKGTPRPPAP